MLSDAGSTQQLTTNIASAVEEVVVTSREIASSSLATLNASQSLDRLADHSLLANDNIRKSMVVLSDDIRNVQSNAAQMEMKVSEIGNILETINTLSDQTNLLALNAAIEAACELELMANNMSSAAEQQSVTTEVVAKDVVVVEEAARHELHIAQQLSELSDEMQRNNHLLQRTIAGFNVD